MNNEINWTNRGFLNKEAEEKHDAKLSIILERAKKDKVYPYDNEWWNRIDKETKKFNGFNGILPEHLINYKLFKKIDDIHLYTDNTLYYFIVVEESFWDEMNNVIGFSPLFFGRRAG